MLHIGTCSVLKSREKRMFDKSLRPLNPKHPTQPQPHQTVTIASSHSFDSKQMELNESDDESQLEDALLDHGEPRTDPSEVDLSEVELNDGDLSGTTTPSDDSNGEEPDRARAAPRVPPQRPPTPRP